MSTRKLGTVLGAAVLLLGVPTSYALAGPGEGKGPDRPPHQCEDGQDNDGDGGVDGADGDCGSPRDNSEGPDEDETGGGAPGGELPALPPELQAVVDELLGQLGGGEEPPAEEPPAEEPPALPVDPAELEAAVQAIVDQLPPPPAG